MRVVRVSSFDHIALTRPCATTASADGHLHPRGELLLADRLRAAAAPPRGSRATRRPTRRWGRPPVSGLTSLPPRGEVLDGGGDLAHEEHLRPLRRPHPQRGVGDPAAHRLAHQLLEVGGHLVRLGDQVDACRAGRWRCGAPRPPATPTPTPRQSHWNRPRAPSIAALSCSRALVLVVAVGEQDGVPLGRARHRGEQPGRQRQPGAHRGAAVGPEPGHGGLGLRARRGVHLHHGRAPVLRVGQAAPGGCRR